MAEINAYAENVIRNNVKMTIAGKTLIRFVNKGMEEVQLESPLSFILGESFNRSNIRFSERPHPENDVFWLVHHVTNTAKHVANLGTSTYWLPQWTKKFETLTCSGLVSISSFAHYVKPYDTKIWGLLLLSMFGMSAMLVLSPQYRTLAYKIPEALLGILLEQFVKVKSNINGPALGSVIGTFSMVAIVVTNAYKGIVITSVVKPFERLGSLTLGSALGKNYTTVLHDRESLRQFCCASSAGLALKISPKSYHVYFGPDELECGDMISIGFMKLLLEQFPSNSTNYKILESHFLTYATLKRASILPTNKNEALLLKVMQNSRPPPCSRVSAAEELFQCNNTLFIALMHEEIMLNHLQEFSDNRRIDRVYRIKDGGSLLYSPSVVLHIIIFISAMNALLRNIQAFVESGIMENLLASEKVLRANLNMKVLRQVFGKLVVQNTVRVPISLQTNLQFTFILYFYCLVVTVVALLLEFSVKHIIKFRSQQIFSSRVKVFQ